ncbi:hypothetical protein AB669_09905 [Pedobacter sp. BMA]|nr:hypothetical protein AB669_09905 [Pedobacter sp. BMA]
MVHISSAQIHHVLPGKRDIKPPATVPKFLDTTDLKRDFKHLVNIREICSHLDSIGSYWFIFAIDQEGKVIPGKRNREAKLFEPITNFINTKFVTYKFEPGKLLDESNSPIEQTAVFEVEFKITGKVIDTKVRIFTAYNSMHTVYAYSFSQQR